MLRLTGRWPLLAALLLSAAIIGCGSGATPETAPSTTPATAPATAAPTEAVAATGQTQPTAAATATNTATTAPAAAPARPEPTDVPATATPESPPETEPTPEPEPAPGTGPVTAPAGGPVYVIGEGSEATFTVNEKLAWLDLPNDAVMRTTGLAGAIYLEGAPYGRSVYVELDLHSMTSDSDRRDGYVQRRMFPDHRTAIFTVADLDALDDPPPNPLPEGEVITRTVPGELQIKGVTKPIVFEIEARLDPGQLFVLGRTTFTWDELEIPPPNIPGRIQVKDEVRVEVLLAAKAEN